MQQGDPTDGEFVGVARSEHGKAPTLAHAIEDAYEKGKQKGHRSFRVEKIVVTGDNPITEYRVVLRPD